MSVTRKILILAFFILVVVELVIFIPESVDVIKDYSDLSQIDPSEDVEQDMKGVHLIEASEGQKEWELWAENATSYKSKAEWNLKEIRVKFFGQKGVFYDVYGENGKITMADKNIEILGEVKLISSNGYRFFTNKILYSSEGRLIEAPKIVKMLGPKTKVRGDELSLVGNRMNIHIQESRMEVLGNIRANKVIENRRKIKIKSELALFSGRSNEVIFEKNVVVDVNSIRVTGPKAQFVYKQETSEIDYVSFDGGVRLSDKNKWATSQKLEAFVSQNKFIFKGNPRLVQGADELQGQEIVLIDGGNLVKVVKANANIDKERLQESKE
ncbi:MAG: LPS export ABC transporter periplasmic protein LptC [Bdellovibrionales bacterium]|nr:LPS export ABC transporter periplasmic protein LptC [Bdellovibrionales bacterium]